MSELMWGSGDALSTGRTMSIVSHRMSMLRRADGMLALEMAGWRGAGPLGGLRGLPAVPQSLEYPER